MVLVRLAYVADLPAPAELVRSLVAAPWTPAAVPVLEAPAAIRGSGTERSAALARLGRRLPHRPRTAVSSLRAPIDWPNPPASDARSAAGEPVRASTRCRRALPRSWRCSTNGARRCCARISGRDVHLVHFEPGRIEFRPAARGAARSRKPPRPVARRMDRDALADRRSPRPRASRPCASRRSAASAICGTRLRRTRWFRRCSKPFRARRLPRSASALRRRRARGRRRSAGDRAPGRRRRSGRGRSMKNIGQLMKQAQADAGEDGRDAGPARGRRDDRRRRRRHGQLTLNGKGDLKKIKIDKTLLDPGRGRGAGGPDRRRVQRCPRAKSLPMPSRRCRS